MRLVSYSRGGGAKGIMALGRKNLIDKKKDRGPITGLVGWV